MKNFLKLNTNQLPIEDRPYEKCQKYGAKILTDSELLAVILRCGFKEMNSIELSQHILNTTGKEGIIGLSKLSIEKLTAIPGVGKVKATQILCIVELAKRFSKGFARSNLEFSTAKTIADYYMEDMRHYEKEHLLLIMLDTKNHYLGEKVISIGTVNSSYLSPREIFIEALNKNAVRIVLIHNHPSGDPTPSREDLLSTSRIKEAGKLIGIELLDHIIIGDKRYTSLHECNILSDKK